MVIQLESALYSHVGPKRKSNQDLADSNPDLGLFILADGMGGHQGGETASKLCVETIRDFFKNSQPSTTTPEPLKESLLRANTTILQHAKANPQLSGMGTTATVMKWDGAQTVHLAQVGDSRAYYWNSKGIWQLTQDHSVTHEKWRAGLISRDQMKTDEMKNVITRSVGYEPNLKVDCFAFPIESGDGFLLCSDGLSNPLSDALMFDILDESTKSGLSLEDMAKQLVIAANERGGDDNVTVVLVRIK
jgi:serine/threonine protein phosphatase PrpC